MSDQVPETNPEEASDHGPGHGQWLTITNAAEQLGIKPSAIRTRIRRGQIRVKSGRDQPDGRTRVWVASDATPDAMSADTPESLDQSPDLVTTLRQIVSDKDTEIRFLRRQLEVRDEQVGRLTVLLQSEQQQVRLLTDQRRPASWWRRWFGPKG